MGQINLYPVVPVSISLVNSARKYHDRCPIFKIHDSDSFHCPSPYRRECAVRKIHVPLIDGGARRTRGLGLKEGTETSSASPAECGTSLRTSQ